MTLNPPKPQDTDNPKKTDPLENSSSSEEDTPETTPSHQADADAEGILLSIDDSGPGTLKEGIFGDELLLPRKEDDLEAKALAESCEKFSELPIDARVQSAIEQLGWTAPTPVQKLCLPFTLKGRDVAGFAQTGTGKTGVFLITICHKLLSQAPSSNADQLSKPRAIVLAPTRELAMQIEDDAKKLLTHSGLNSVAIFGGVDYEKQASRLKEGIDIIVATPGRLMDYCKKDIVDLSAIKIFVCDEADRMFDMGFIEDVEFFLQRIPDTTQKLLFSATTNDQVKELAFEYLENPEYISVNPEVLTPEKIEQRAIHVHARHKLKVIMGLLREHNPDCAIIFTNTKLTADWLWFKLQGNGFEVDLITGDLPQKKRIRLIERIKRGELKVLIATDVASRGLHISRVSHVYNFDLPDDPSNYIHRIGRTARAGARGTAISFVCDDYGQNLSGINTLLGQSHTLNSVWFDEKYLEIEDKAGNPFKIQQQKAKEESSQRSGSDGRTHRSRFAGDGRDSSRYDSRREGRHKGERHQGGRDKSSHQALGQKSHSHNKDRHRTGNDKRYQSDKQRFQGQKNRQDRRWDEANIQSREKHQPNSKLPVTTQPKGLLSMLKALFRSIFGKKSRKKD